MKGTIRTFLTLALSITASQTAVFARGTPPDGEEGQSPAIGCEDGAGWAIRETM